MGFDFGDIDVDGLDSDLKRFQREAEEAEKTRVPMFYPKKGNTTLWVLPPATGSRSWFYQAKEHSFNLDGKLYYKKCLGDDCPICEAASEFYQLGGEANVKRSSELRAGTKGFMNVLILSAPEGSKFEKGKVYVAKVAKTVITGLLNWDRDVQNPLQTHDITGAVHYFQDQNQGLAGVPMIIERTGQGLGTRYNVKPGGVRIRLEDQLKQSEIDVNIDDLQLYNLADACPDVEYEEMQELANKLRGVSAKPEPKEVEPPIATMSQGAAVPDLPDPPQ